MDHNKLTFQDWLLGQVPRDDSAGRFARLTLQIDTFAKIENSYPSWHRLFASHGAQQDLNQLMQVWSEYLEARAQVERRP